MAIKLRESGGKELRETPESKRMKKYDYGTHERGENRSAKEPAVNYWECLPTSAKSHCYSDERREQPVKAKNKDTVQGLLTSSRVIFRVN